MSTVVRTSYDFVLQKDAISLTMYAEDSIRLNLFERYVDRFYPEGYAKIKEKNYLLLIKNA